MTKTKPLCGRCEAGWVYPDDGGEPARCHCRTPQPTPETARDEALQAAAMSHEQAFRTAYRIIEEEAAESRYLSANSVRTAMETAQIPGPVVGAAFRKAHDEGLIERDGYVPSTQASTHAHPIVQWRSRSYSTQLGVI